MLPLVSHGANLFNLCPLPDSSALYVQNWFPIGPAVWPNFPVFWIVDPIKPPKMPPWGNVGRIVFSLCPLPDESTEVYQIWCKSVQPFDSFPRLFNLWPLNPPPPRHAPWGIEGRLVFSLYPFPDESADVNQSWCQSVQPFDSFLWPLVVWPPKTPKCPLVSLGAICLAYIHSQINLQMWCQSDQPFESSPDFWICVPLTPPPCRGATCI